MTTSTARPKDLAAEALRITRQVHELRRPIGDQDRRITDAVDLFDHLAPFSTETSKQCTMWCGRVPAAMDELDRFTATARPALEEAGRLLGDLTALVAADERRRADDVVAEARRRRLDAEVQRLADGEEAAEQAARRERLEQQAREELADTTGAASNG